MPAGDAHLPDKVRGSPTTTADIGTFGRRLQTASGMWATHSQTLSIAETLTVSGQPVAVSPAEPGQQQGLSGLLPGPGSQEPEAETRHVSGQTRAVRRADGALQQGLSVLLPNPASQELSTSQLTSSMEPESAASRPGATRPELHPAAAAQAAVLLQRPAWNQTGLPQRSLLHDGPLRAGEAMLPGEVCKVEVVAGFPWQQHSGSWLNTISMRITNTGVFPCHASRECHAV